MSTQPVTDDQRDRVVELLRDHVGTGRLEMDEFARRMDEAYAATTQAELDQVLRGLAAPQGDVQPGPEPARRGYQPRTRVGERIQERHRARHHGPGFPVPPIPPIPPVVRDVARSPAAREAAWRAHLSTYVSVNGFLVFIWTATSFGEHFWPMWPMGGWGVGLYSHWAAVRAARRKERRARREAAGD